MTSWFLRMQVGQIDVTSFVEPWTIEWRAEITARGSGQSLNAQAIGTAFYPPSIERDRLTEKHPGHLVLRGTRRKSVCGSELERPARCANLLRLEPGREPPMT